MLVIEHWGRLFYHHRDVIALPFFFLLLIFARTPQIRALPLVVLGLIIRMWAAGYIGEPSRQKSFSADYVISNGPYRYIKHPLYVGNCLLVCGVTFFCNPPLWLIVLILAAFLVEYSIITYSETHYVKTLPSKAVQFTLWKCKGELYTLVVVASAFFLYWVRLVAFSP